MISAVYDEELVPNPEADFYYDLTRDEKGVVITEYIGESADVVIPSQIEDLPVTKIGDRSFSSNSGIKSVVILEGVVEIGEMSFCYDKNLQSVKLPNTLKK